MNKKKAITPEHPWVKAFRTGKFKDMSGTEHDFSEQDLQDLNGGIQKQLADGFKPALVKGHPAVDSPREGSVEDSRLADDPKLGKVLEVKLGEVNPDFAEEAQKGQWKYLSAAVYQNLKKGLRHLGALGANPPAMKGLELAFGEGMFAEIDRGEKPENIIMFAEPYEWDKLVPASVFAKLVWAVQSFGGILRNLRESEIARNGLESADKLYPEYSIQTVQGVDGLLDDQKNFPSVTPPAPPEPPAQPPVPVTVTNFAEGGAPAPGSVPPPADPGKPGVQTSQTPDPQTKGPSPDAPKANEPTGNAEETARLRTENEALKARIASAERAEADRAAFAEFGTALDAAQKDGRLNVSQRKGFEALFRSLRRIPVDAEGCFAESDGTKQNPMTVLSDAVKAMPKLVEFGERAGENPGETAGDAHAIAARIKTAMADAEQKGISMSFAEAAEKINKGTAK